MSLYAVLDVARMGMIAQAGGLSVTGENIQNANTPGYVRRSAQLEAMARMKGVAGGVNFAGVARAHDGITFRRLVADVGRQGAAASRLSGLQAAEAALAPSSGTIAERLGAFFGAFEGLALDADDPVARADVLAKADAVAQSFHDTASGLVELRGELYGRAQGVVTTVNDKLRTIAELDNRIAQSVEPDSSRAELLDQRDQLVREVGESIGVNAIEGDDGRLTLVSSGVALVDGGRAATLGVSLDGNGNLLFELQKPSGTTIDITSRVDGGALGGLREARDVDVVAAQGRLDQLASEVAGAINTAHAAGVGLDGVGGRPIFTDAAGGPVPPPPGTALALFRNPTLTGDQIAASSTAAGLPGGNDVALAMSNLSNATLPSGFTPAGGYAALSGFIGSAVVSAQNDLSLREASVAHVDALRESQSGVSLDEEMVALTRYQRAYEASLKVLQTADEMLQELLQRF